MIVRSAFCVIVALGLLAALASAPAAAATYYWDTSGTAAGFGTASGTWGTDSFWSTSSAGTTVPTSLTTTSSDTVNFGFIASGTTLSLSTGTVNISGAQTAGTFATAGTGALTFTGGTLNVTSMNIGAAGLNFNSVLNIPAGTTTTAAVLSGAGKTVLSGPVIGGGNLVMSGAGILTLSGSNTYSGTTSINAGALIFSASSSLPAAVSPPDISIARGAALGATGPFSTVTGWLNSGRIAGGASGAISITVNSNEAIDLTTAGGGTYSSLYLGSIGTNTYTGTLTPAADTYRLGGANGMLVLAGNTALTDGAGPRSVVIGGNVTLSGSVSNSFTGATVVDNGLLYFNKSGGAVAVVSGGTVQMGGGDANQPSLRMSQNNQFGSGVLMTFSNTGGNLARFDLQGTNQTLGGISCSTSAGVIENVGLATTTPPSTSPAWAVLTLNLAGGSSYFYNGSMRNSDSTSTYYGMLGLTVAGAGNQTLAGSNISFGGTTTLTGGTLTLQDTTAFGSPIVLNPGATLVCVRTVTGTAGASPIVTNSVSGTGVLDVNNPGSGIAGGWTTITGLTMSGTINVNSGAFAAATNSPINATAAVNVAPGAAFAAGYNSNSIIGALNGAGDVGTFRNNNGSITLGNGGGSGSFSGILHGSGGSGLETGNLSLAKIGAGTQFLSGTNTYTLNTFIGGGALDLDFTAAGAPKNNIINSGTDSSKLMLGGGTLNVLGNLSIANSQQFNGVAVNANANSIAVSGGLSPKLALGFVAGGPGSTVDFVLPSSGSITTTAGNEHIAGGQPTIMGFWATVGGSTWAVSGTGATPYAISGLTNYSSTFAAGTDVSVSASAAPAAMTINSLRFTGGASIASSGLTIATGGILETAAVGANPISVSGGSFNSGNNFDLTIIQNNPAGTMAIGSAVAGSFSLTKAGPGVLTLTNSANNYSYFTDVIGGTLQLGANGSLPNGTNNIVNVCAGDLDLNGYSYNTGAAFNLGGGPGGSTAAITLGAGTLMLQNDLTYSNTNNAAGATISAGAEGELVLAGTRTFTVAYSPAAANDLTISANISGSGAALTKAGPGRLLLTGTCSYDGPTTISAGTLALGGGNNPLPVGGTVNFNAYGTLNMGSVNQTLANVNVGYNSVGIINGPGSLTVSGTGFSIGAILEMPSLSNFTYNGAGTSFFVGSSGEVLVELGVNNTITAATCTVDNATLYLGQNNTINADNMQVGGSGNVIFQSGLAANPTLKIRGSAGGSSRANLNVGTGESGTNQNINGELDLVDGTNGTRDACQLDALIGTMLVGQTYYGGGGFTIGTFVMGSGTLDATTIVIGQRTGTDSTGGFVYGLVNVDGGEMLAATLTLGDKQNNTGTVTAGFALNGGTLSAGTIQPGANSASRTFYWYDGTIANYDGSSGTTNLTISIPSLTLANTGTHAFWIDAGRTGTVSSAIGELAPGGTLVKNGGGTLILSGTNGYTGGTVVEAGTLIATNNEAIADGTNLSVGTDLTAFGTVGPAQASQATAASAVASVPEPGTLALLAVAGLSLLPHRRRH